MYLEHFGLTEQPFGLTPNTQFFCPLTAHQEALDVLLVALHSGEGFVKITGEVGTGKTMLCRKLLNELDEAFVTAYIPNPAMPPDDLLHAVTEELGFAYEPERPTSQRLKAINQRLLEVAASGRRTVLVLDEAQAIPPASLEMIRLLTNLETESQKLLQIVLFGQPELDTLLNRGSFRQLKQRITFSYRLPRLSRAEAQSYLFNRLRIAGFKERDLLTTSAYWLIHWYSRGTPRLLNILANKALMLAYGQGQSRISANYVTAAAADTEGVAAVGLQPFLRWGAGALLFAMVSVAAAFWHEVR